MSFVIPDPTVARLAQPSGAFLLDRFHAYDVLPKRQEKDGQPARQQMSSSLRHGFINDYNIQRTAINKVIDILGSSIWEHGFRSGR